MVLENVAKNVENAKKMIRHTVLNLNKEERNCECATALQNAILTNVDAISAEARQKFDLLVGKYLD